MADQAISGAVDRAGTCIWATFKPRPSFLATHFSCGTPGLPGYIIKSAAMAIDGRFAEWARNADGSSDESLHGKVIIRHARQFQRSTTIPALLARLSDSLRKPVILTLRVSAEDGKLLHVQKSRKDGCTWFALELGQAFASALCPPDLPDKYLRKLYDDEKNKRSDSLKSELRPFDLPRSEAFGLLISRSGEEELKIYVNALIPDDPNDRLEHPDYKTKTWRLLEMLQSALLYFEGARAADSQSAVTGFACAFPLQIKRRTRNRPNRSDTPFGFALGAPLVTLDTHKMRDCFERRLWNDEVQKHINGDDKNEVDKKLRALTRAVSRVTGGTVEEIQDGWSSHLQTEIEAIVPFSGPQERLRLLGLWMVYLISKLKGARHEGKAVDFWFVAGERTEFADDKDVRLEKHPLQVRRGDKLDPDREFDCKKFVTDQNELNDRMLVVNEKACSLIIRRLEKEHYPWFSQGRYALFFDISTDGLNPCGLAELRSGSWNRLLAESFKLPDEQELHVPGCLVGFVDGASGEAGLLVCQPEKPGLQKARVKRTLRLRDGRWQLASDKRQAELDKYLKVNVPWLTEDKSVEMLGQMIIMIADDPHAGGTLVFVEDKLASNSFLRLGAPWEWEFDVAHQDRIPLISHDGGTIVWMEQDHIKMAYRQLLTLEGDIKNEVNSNNGNNETNALANALAVLQQRSLGKEADFPLLGVGTRRWSAALCALRRGVKMVVVISTDGDITCWWGKTEGTIELWYYSLPVDSRKLRGKRPKNVLADLKKTEPPSVRALPLPQSEGNGPWPDRVGAS